MSALPLVMNFPMYENRLSLLFRCDSVRRGYNRKKATYGAKNGVTYGKHSFFRTVARQRTNRSVNALATIW